MSADALMRLTAEGAIVQLTDDEVAQRREDVAVLAGPAVPSSVYDYQFAGQAAAEGIIDYEAAKAWSGPGTVPQVLLDAVDGLLAAGAIDPDRHSRVILFLMGTKEFPRSHDLTPVLAASFGKDTPEKVDAFFIAAGAR